MAAGFIAGLIVGLGGVVASVVTAFYFRRALLVQWQSKEKIMQLRRITIKARRFWQHERLVKRLEAFEGRQIADGIWDCRMDERGRRDLEGFYGPVLHIELTPSSQRSNQH